MITLDERKRTMAKYAEEHKDYFLAYRKQYYEKNKDEILAKCKQYDDERKVEIAAKHKQKVKCVCGCDVNKYFLVKHMKTAKHMCAMAQLAK